jgi:putative ABC transport system permease protein
VRATLVRVRAFAGYFAVLAVLAALTTLLITAVPRIAGQLADDGLRQQIRGEPAAVRDITYRLAPDPGEPRQPDAAGLARQLDSRLAAMPPAVRGLITERWYVAETPVARTTNPDLPPGPPLDLILRTVGRGDAVTLAAGRRPAQPAEVMLAAPVAAALHLRLGSSLRMAPPAPGRGAPTGAGPFTVTVVGLFTATDPAGGIWDPLPPALAVTAPSGRRETDPMTAVALTSDAAVVARRAARWPVSYAWRYRVDPDRLRAAEVPAVLDGIHRIDRTHERRIVLTMGLDAPLRDFRTAQDAARAVLFIVLATVLATVAGLVVLTARLLVRRRAREFGLLRARGAARADLVRRSAAESLLVVAPAAAAGWVLGGAGYPGWPAAAGALIVAGAYPVAVLAGDGRRYRLSAEVSILLLAAVATYLLRRRGLPAAGRLDPLLVGAPVLLTLAAAVLVLRGYPWLLRGAGRLAARARGAIAFLAVALARRGATGSLVVVVVAVAGAAFCAGVATGIRDGRDRATALAVPADALLTADFFAADTAAALAALPDVRAVSPLVARASQQTSRPGGGQVERTYVLVVDGPSFTRVARASAAGFTLPAALAGATAAGGPAPALVSPAVAADLDRGGVVTAQNRPYPFRIAGVAASFPTIPPGTRRFVVLPGQALPGAWTPTGFLIAAGRVDVAALRRTGDAGRNRYYSTGLVVSNPPAVTPVVATRSAVHTGLEREGANGLLTFGFTGGVLGGSVLALAAVAFAALADAPARARVLARLRTMGLSRRQRNRMLIVELAPPVGLAVLAGAALGLVLPLLVGPVLRLSAFTGGVDVPLRADARLAGGVVVFGMLALALAIAVEAVADRRLGRGRQLREED